MNLRHKGNETIEYPVNLRYRGNEKLEYPDIRHGGHVYHVSRSSEEYRWIIKRIDDTSGCFVSLFISPLADKASHYEISMYEHKAGGPPYWTEQRYAMDVPITESVSEVVRKACELLNEMSGSSFNKKFSELDKYLMR